MNTLQRIGLFLVLLALVGFVGTADMEDQIAEEQFYIEMVCDGKWPDYNNLQPECD